MHKNSYTWGGRRFPQPSLYLLTVQESSWNILLTSTGGDRAGQSGHGIAPITPSLLPPSLLLWEARTGPGDGDAHITLPLLSSLPLWEATGRANQGTPQSPFHHHWLPPPHWCSLPLPTGKCLGWPGPRQQVILPFSQFSYYTFII